MKLSNKKILIVVASVFLFVALFDGLPYGYFTFLRFVVCSVGIYIAYKAYKLKENALWTWVLGGISVLFNPIFPIQLERDIWVIIDLIVGVFFLTLIFVIREEKVQDERKENQESNSNLRSKN
jgi:hypothetical protein